MRLESLISVDCKNPARLRSSDLEIFSVTSSPEHFPEEFWQEMTRHAVFIWEIWRNNRCKNESLFVLLQAIIVNITSWDDLSRQDTELCYNVHDPEDPDWQELCERGPGHRYKTRCVTQDIWCGLRDIGQSTSHNALCVTSVSRVTWHGM